MRLTTAALGNLKLDGGATDKIIFDDEVPGFGIRIRASGAQTWIFQYKIAGKTRRLVLGQVSAIKLAKARECPAGLGRVLTNRFGRRPLAMSAVPRLRTQLGPCLTCTAPRGIVIRPSSSAASCVVLSC
jgi:hypothetical protein